jgi:U5 small nuclear ribonucleoprotein component
MWRAAHCYAISAPLQVGTLWVYQARYRTAIGRATAGNLVLVEGIDATISKTATVVAEFYDQPVGCPLSLLPAALAILGTACLALSPAPPPSPPLLVLSP